MRTTTLEDEIRALDAGTAYAELDVSVTAVGGGDARGWLHDLVTTDVESLVPAASRPSLLLTPTGRIRASFQVLCVGEREFLLAQPSDAPERVQEILAPYVLSSDVDLRPSPTRILAVPGGSEAPETARAVQRPSMLGGGFDVLVASAPTGSGPGSVPVVGRTLASSAAVEARRIRLGEPRFPVDLDRDASPAEAGWDVAPVTDRGKGCFLGQEAVARIANLGHPVRLVLPVSADATLRAGDGVLAGGTVAGSITSADGRVGIAGIRWAVRDAPLSLASGAPVRRR